MPVARFQSNSAKQNRVFARHGDTKSTIHCIHLEKQIHKNGWSEDFNVVAAKAIDEASNLIAVGFEFIHEFNGVMLYRKRKERRQQVIFPSRMVSNKS